MEVLGALRQRDSLAPQCDTGLGEPPQRQGAESPLDVLQPGRGPRHPAGGRPAVEDLRRLVEVDGDWHQLRRSLNPVRPARGDEEVDQRVRLLILVDIMKPPAPNPVSWLSQTNEVRTAQIAASTALPPSRSTCAPASAVSG